MKWSVKFTISFIAIVTFLPCCKKDQNIVAESAPVANAGPDQAITLPVDSVFLDGSQSEDVNGNISTYKWEKIAGPSISNIKNSTAVKTWAIDLVEGVYRFELKVTDSTGLLSKDTVQVIVIDAGHPNSPPVAKAGGDQNIFLPTSSVTLIGESSADPGGSIISYWWSQLSGPNQSVIVNPNASNTAVTGLVEGRYQFRLEVTDNSGETGNDTVAVVVNPWPQSITVFPAQVTWLTPLSIWRVATTGATAGDKVLFAGGISIDWYGYITGFFSRVDIYDYTTNIWSTAELSQARYHMAAAAAGNKIVFAGGETASGEATTRVDIYDVATNTWSIAELSTPRKDMAAASSGSKILFAGGDAINSDGFITSVFSTVDIYDVITNRWSTATLSEARGSILAGSAGDKILFAGGLTTSGPPSNRVDIYDASTGVWSMASLSQAAVFEAATAVGNKIIYAGENQVTVYDAASESWSIESLNQFDFLSSGAHYFTGAVTAGNFAAFFSPGIRRRFLIYSAVGQIWGVSSEVEILFDGWDAFVAANNQVFIAGWEGVRRVQF